MKVVIVQRIIPHYRIKVFELLQEKLYSNGHELIITYGNGEKTGSQINSKNMGNLIVKKIKTLSLKIKFNGVNFFMPLHYGLLRYLINEKPDIIITEGGKVNFFNIFKVYMYSKIAKKPYIMWVPGPLNKKKSFIKNLTNRLLEFFIKDCNAVIAYSSLAEEYLLNFKTKKYIFKAQNSIYVDTNKYNSEQFVDKISNFKTRYNITGKKIVLYVGALEKRKKVDILIESLNLLNDENIVLLIIGDGPEKGYLKGLASINTIFLGKIIQDVEMFFKMCDLFVLPGQGGLSINQAIAFEKPVICGVSDGTEKDLIGGNGLIIDDMNKDNLANSICKVLGDSKKYKIMCDNSKKKYLETNIENMINVMYKAIIFSID